jgi:hypothetical protein
MTFLDALKVEGIMIFALIGVSATFLSAVYLVVKLWDFFAAPVMGWVNSDPDPMQEAHGDVPGGSHG